jgi:hypothetical protein
MKRSFARTLFLAPALLGTLIVTGQHNPSARIQQTGSFGDTTVVQTLRYDSTLRAGMFQFPDDSTKTYEKILMLYGMRCKDGLVSTGTQRNLGCGEWDYNCYTYLIDSSQTDSLRTTQVSPLISNFSGTVFPYTQSPVYTYFRTNQQEMQYTSVISETSAVVGTGTDTVWQLLGASVPVRRSQVLFTAAELTSAGFTAGDITGMKLDLSALGSSLGNLRIRMKLTTAASLNPDSADLTGFTEVYYLNTAPVSTGSHAFNFYRPFTWNGVSNLLVEYSYSNPLPGTDNGVAGQPTGFTSAMTASGPDAYLYFDGSISQVQMNPSVGDSLSNEITIAFWAYGDPAKLPANTSLLEALDSSGKRQLNIHFPWNDGTIYWDCGNDGTGYDRISKTAAAAVYEGTWNFWAFTKNTTTGYMRVYLNGVQWNSSAGKTKPMHIDKFIVGRNASGGNPYYGYLDELSIWNKELPVASIRQIMNRHIDPSHPDFASLLVYYPFDEGTGSTATDASVHGFNSDILNAGWRQHDGTTLYKNFSAGTSRPNLTFVRGTYTSTLQQYAVLDSTLNHASSLIHYAVTPHTLSIVDTLYAWMAGYSYVYDSAGVPVDSVAVVPQGTDTVTTLVYYRVRPMRMELINFITPYGIGLDLDGLNGKTWIFDVTDFAPVLKGMKYLAMEDGKYQEQNDIRFVFYEGTPPRDVRSISQIWPSGSWVSPSYAQIVNNTYFEPRVVTLDSGAAGYKIRSAISGHGQEGEFIPRSHTLTLNGTANFTRTVWKGCATNPIYPQGGTWIYDRAGWCPGAAVDLKEYELTSLVTPGQTVTLDYSLPANPNPGTSNYRVNNQLVSYGPPNFTLDAALADIKTPSDRTEYMRMNPICNTPLVTIRNTGSATLTSLDIHYGREGGPLSTYHWTGSLSFLQQQDISLPAPVWLGTSVNRFIAYVSNPNGGVDAYAPNDTLTSTFSIPDQLPSALMFRLQTNHAASENTYTIRNSAGTTVFSRSGLANDSLYQDTVYLGTDCYTLQLNDLGEDGLSFWNNPGAGNGWFQITDLSGGTIYKNFDPDFGNNIYQQFTVNYLLNTYAPPPAAVTSLVLFPNPAKDNFSLRMDVPLLSKVQVSVMNTLSQVVMRTNVVVSSPGQTFVFPTGQWPAGTYFVTADAGNSRMTTKLLVIRE